MAHGDHLKYQAKPRAGKQTLLRLASYLVCDRMLLVLIGGLIVISIAANLGGSYLLRPIINRYIIPGDFIGWPICWAYCWGYIWWGVQRYI